MGARIQNIGGNIPTLIVGWAVTIILFISGNFITGNRADATEQKEKEIKIQEQINCKADVVWVKEYVDNNNKIVVKGIEYLIISVDELNDRTKRLESIQMGRK